MKSFLILFFGSISILSFGQETTIHTIEWEQLAAPLSLVVEENSVEKYQLLEIDLSIDLREQYLRKKTSILELPQEHFIAPKYNVAIEQPKSFSFRVSGNGSSNSNNSGGVKNIAYKDAGFYSGAFCPITGLAY
ncbi:hypothetical protein [Aquimarina sp. AU474]|uniref:hypothetical protein n=1 Tax=Aquimarina sp. AU474 TaxID=2108529 RepID=UPI000D68A8D9|nr:hypothetical protein [Aquimarina sp. AU474]